MREGVVLVVVVALPESVREDRECSVTLSSLSTFSADWCGGVKRKRERERGGGGGGERRGEVIPRPSHFMFTQMHTAIAHAHTQRTPVED